MDRKLWPLYLIPLILFILLSLSESVERSMYTDGVAYAGLSMNMANGIGSFWFPKLSEVHHFSFHEHPPLIFGIQSLFFEVFGNGIVTERIYALTVFLLSALMVVLLWRKALMHWPTAKQLYFIPLTLWLANEVVYHFYPANVLEPTMTLFTLGAVLLCMHGVEDGNTSKEQYLFAILSAFLIFLATLCKGFVALFPLAFFAFYWLVFRKISLSRAVALSLVSVATVGVCYLLLLQYESAKVSLTRYFDSQVLASLLSERSYENHFRSSRFYIIEKLVLVLLPSLILTIAIAFGVRKYNKQGISVDRPQRWASLFLLLGLSASVPLAISPKQSFYYLLPSMVYYALAFGLYIVPELVAIAHSKPTPLMTRILQGLVVAGLIAGCFNTYRHWGIVNRRDRVVLNDLDQINSVVDRGSTVGVVGEIKDLVSYAYREHQLSLDTTVSHTTRYEYIIAPLEENVSIEGVEMVPLEVIKYGLYLNEKAIK